MIIAKYIFIVWDICECFETSCKENIPEQMHGALFYYDRFVFDATV